MTINRALKRTPRPALIIPRLGVSGEKSARKRVWRGVIREARRGEARTEAVAAEPLYQVSHEDFQL